jgi:hypothetical protein
VDRDGLAQALATALPSALAGDFASQFIEIRRDVATGTLGRASPGKFVETLVQSLQALERGGSYEAKPDVDKYLRGLDSRQSSLPEGLRICASRLGRAMYSIRSKRSIVHKGAVDPASYDLRLLYSGAQWILTELLALATGIDGEKAARLAADVQLPVGELVEALGDRFLVHADLTVEEEALVVLGKYYPDPIPTGDLARSMDRRRPGSVNNALTKLWKTRCSTGRSPVSSC